MEVVACGVEDITAAKNLTKNLFMNSFQRHLRGTKQDTKDTFKPSEKRNGNEIAIEPHTKAVIMAFHDWVKVCHWLGGNPALTQFPLENADAISEKVEFILNSSGIKSTAKPDLFTQDDQWDNQAKSLGECLGPLPEFCLCSRTLWQSV